MFRFNEPRFAKARNALGVHECQSCHAEHQGAKVVIQATYCSECHEGLEIENDPVDVPHVELAKGARWETCLGCHDFHGNHERTTPTKLDRALSPGDIERYFAGAKSPYGDDLKARARNERSDLRE